jgi:hypothetical protein
MTKSHQSSTESANREISSYNPSSHCASYVHPYTDKFVILRSYGSGVHFGILKSFDPSTGVAFIRKARRLYYWEKGFTLSEVSINGIGGGSKLPHEVEEMMVCNVLELIPATDKAIKSIQNWGVTSYGENN